MDEWGKIELLRQYECWTDKTSNLCKRGVKKKNITIRVSFLSRASLNLCPGLLQSLQPNKSDNNGRSFKYIFACKIHFVYAKFFSAFANCLASVYVRFDSVLLVTKIRIKRSFVLNIIVPREAIFPFFNVFCFLKSEMWMFNLRLKM